MYLKPGKAQKQKFWDEKKYQSCALVCITKVQVKKSGGILICQPTVFFDFEGENSTVRWR